MDRWIESELNSMRKLFNTCAIIKKLLAKEINFIFMI